VKKNHLTHFYLVVTTLFFFCSFIFYSPTVTHAAAPTPLASWKLNETSGTSAADDSGNGYGGTVHGTADWQTGKIGNGLQFDGSTYVDVSPVPSVNNPLTITAWVNPSQTSQAGFSGVTGATIIDENEDSGSNGWILSLRSNGQLWFWSQGGFDSYSNAIVPTNQWTHIAITYDGTDIRLYINGTLDSTHEIPAPQGSATFFKIGGKSWVAGNWKGLLDEVSIYNSTLSDSDIASVYAEGVQRPFIFTVKTDNAGDSNDHSFIIPIEDGLTYNYNVDWGDGDTTTGTTTSASHTYAVAGEHQISVSGTFPLIKFNFGGDRNKIISIDQWGTNKWQGMSGAFSGCSNLTFTATDAPDLSLATDFTYTFRGTGLTDEDLNSWDVSHIHYFLGTFQDTAFNGAVSDWNMSGATNLAAMFYNDASFDQDVSEWDVSSVTNMNSMFAYAAAFNNGEAPLFWGSHTSLVQDMSTMFYHATAFNQDVSDWDVSSVTNMNSMFEGASAFNNSDEGNTHNKPLLWSTRTSKVTNMQGMFTDTLAFNQDVSSWDTSHVTAMAYMFSGANLFDQDVSGWDISAVTNMSNMFLDAAMSTKNYDAFLKTWSKQIVHHNVSLGVGTSRYCDTASHSVLTGATYGWTITDGGLVCSSAPQISFIGATPAANTVLTDPTSIPVEMSLSSESSRYSLVDLDKSLLGWWRFEHSSVDDSSFGQAGVWKGTEAYTLGAFGDAGSFNGATSFDVTLADKISPSYTVSAWVKLNSVDEGSAIISDANGHILQIGGSNRWQFDNVYSGAAVATAGQWTHLVGVYNADTGQETLYVNGVAVVSGGATRSLTPTIYIGKRTDNLYLNGKIDDVAIFGRALGADEVSALYSNKNTDYAHTFTTTEQQKHHFTGYVVDEYGVQKSTGERTVLSNATTPVSSSLQKSTTVQAQVANLIKIGKPDRAKQVMSQWSTIFAPQASSTTSIFTRNLNKGMSGEDVRALQIYLNTHGFVIAPSGPGSLGNETLLFGELTRLALAKFQASKNILPALGYFGSLTRAYVGGHE
jgi:surface protein